eukprot:gene6302-4535_t
MLYFNCERLIYLLKRVGEILGLIRNNCEYVNIKNDKFILNEVLGEGAFSIVYRATNLRSKETFAVKRIFLNDSDASDCIEECVIHASLCPHKNIVQIIDSDISSTSCNNFPDFWITMDLCSTSTLQQLIEKKIRSQTFFSSFEILSIVENLLAAIGHLHGQSPPIAHFDVKPQNFLYANETFKLCDFGSASKSFYQPKTAQEIIQAEQHFNRKMTQAYRSPESLDLWSGHKVDMQADVWSLGILIYFLIFEELPFEHPLEIINGTPKHVPRGDCEQIVDIVLSKMLVKNPEERATIFEVSYRFSLISRIKPLIAPKATFQMPQQSSNNLFLAESRAQIAVLLVKYIDLVNYSRCFFHLFIYYYYYYYYFLYWSVKVTGKMSRKNQIGRNFLQTDKEFNLFAERMNDIGKTYWIAAAKPGTVPLQAPPPEDQKPVSEASDEWLDACFKDYLDRRKAFETRFKSKNQLVLRIVIFSAIFLAVLWVIWPVWSMFSIFFSVTTDDAVEGYFSTLNIGPTTDAGEIKKAYREAMIKIQEAHDVLLSRGDQRFVLANIEQKRVSELRSFIMFRMYQMASSSAKQLNALSSIALGSILRQNDSSYVGIMFNLITFALFTSFEFMKFGVNWIVMLQLLYHIMSLVKPNAEKLLAEVVIKASYVDLYRETLVVLSVVLAGEIIRVLAGPRGNLAIPQLLEIVLGFLYVLSFLNRFTPNIRDNIVMRKCSISPAYVDPAQPRINLLRIVSTEIGFLFDDLFVHSAGISFVPRVTVYTMHFVYLCQMVWLPWDAPISFRRKKAVHQPARSTSHENATPPAKEVQSSVKHREEMRSAAVEERSTEPLSTASQLSDAEVGMLYNLDKEGVQWLDVPFLKYSSYQPARAHNPASAGEVQEIMQFRAASDLQNFLVIHCSKAPTGQLSNPRIVKQCHDPEMCRLVAMDGGRDALTQVKGNQMLPLPPNFYENLFGSIQHKMTNSDVWRFRVYKERVPQCTVQRLLLATLGFAVTLFICAFVTPPLVYVLRSTREIMPSQRPLLHGRFVPHLPPEHALNEHCAGLLTWGNAFVLLVPDFWDAVRQLQRLVVHRKKSE